MSNRRVSDKLAEANVSPGDVASSLLERARFDLHLHTTASDGTDTPETVVALAKQAGCAVIAITDHDTMEGLTAGICAAQVERLTLIPGMEVSAGGEAEIHLLAYGVSAADTRLQAVLDAWRQERRARVERMLEKCRMQGLKLEMEDFPAKCSIGRAHVAAAMVRAGAVKDLRQAFDRYLGVGKPCYVPRNTVSATKVITWLRDCGAVPVLAHPGQLRMGDQALTSCLPDWCAAGLLGIEAYHASHQPNAARAYARIAERYHLLVTGGSDYHGTHAQAHIGDGTAAWQEAERDVQRLCEMIASVRS